MTIFRCFSLCILVSLGTAAYPGESTSRPVDFFSIEVGGAGYAGSVTWERRVWDYPMVSLRTVFGVSWFPSFINGKPDSGNWIFPLGVRGVYRFGGSAHALELGLQAPLAFGTRHMPEGDSIALSVSFVPSLGYRSESVSSRGFFFSAAYSPRIYLLPLPFGGTSIGYANGIRLSGGIGF